MHTVTEQLSKWTVNGNIHISHYCSVRHVSGEEWYDSDGSEFEWETSV